MHFCQAVAIIQSQVGIIKGVQVLYSDKVFSILFYNPTLSFKLKFYNSLESLGYWSHFGPSSRRYSVYISSSAPAFKGMKIYYSILF